MKTRPHLPGCFVEQEQPFLRISGAFIIHLTREGSVNWDNLRFFLAVARAGSIRKAAQDLHVTHSTVSRRIDAFERDLDARLFERLPTGYLLTTAGEAVQASAERIEGEVDQVARRVMGQDARLSGRLKVALPDALAQGLLMTALVRFSEIHPQIELELLISTRMADLSRREADVAVRLSNDPPASLVGRRLLRSARANYAAPAYLARHQADPHMMRWIGWADTVPAPQWVRESDLPHLTIQNRVADPMVQQVAARSGMGVAMLPCFLGDPDPELVRVPPAEATPDRDIWLLTHEDLRHTARVRRLMAHLAEAILGERALLEGQQP